MRTSLPLHLQKSSPFSMEILNKFQQKLSDYVWPSKVHGFKANDYINLSLREDLMLLTLFYMRKHLNLLVGQSVKWTLRLSGYSYCESCLRVPLKILLAANLNRRHLNWMCVKLLPPVWKCILEYWCEFHFKVKTGHVAIMPLAFNSTLASHGCKYVLNDTCLPFFHKEDIYSVQDFIEYCSDLHPSLPPETQEYLDLIMQKVPHEWIEQVDMGATGEQCPCDLLLLKHFLCS